MRVDITYDQIEEEICKQENVPVEYIHTKKRKREIVLARQLMMYYANKNKLGTLAEIGKRFGDKDHATVLHAIKCINNSVNTNRAFREKMKTYDKLFDAVNAVNKKAHSINLILQRIDNKIETMKLDLMEAEYQKDKLKQYIDTLIYD